jgi:hypothetical protein
MDKFIEEFKEDWCRFFHHKKHWIYLGNRKLICHKCLREYKATVINGQVYIGRRDV